MIFEIISAIVIFFQTLFGSNHSGNISEASLSTPLSENTIFIENKISPTLPIRNWNIENIDIDAASVIAFDLKSKSILYQKNIEEKRPIASLTKIFTTTIFLENISKNELDEATTVSKNAIDTYGQMGNLSVDEKISLKGLLYMMLLQSSNDAAVAIMEYLQTARGINLVDRMNEKATELNLQNTFFADPAGLDPQTISSALDLIKIIKYALNQNLIWEIMRLDSIDLYSADGQHLHHLSNTNKLLNKLPNVIGGKTGYIDEAGECMILVINIPEKENKIILVVLGAKDRFAETEKLANWINEAYVF